MFKTLTPILIILGITSAHAAVAPLKLPTVNGYAVTLPGLSSVPMIMPGVTSALAPITVPALATGLDHGSSPAILPFPEIPSIRPARLPSVPSPLALPMPVELNGPLATAVEQQELSDALHDQDPLGAGKVFDGRRVSARQLALPSARFF